MVPGRATVPVQATVPGRESVRDPVTTPTERGGRPDSRPTASSRDPNADRHPGPASRFRRRPSRAGSPLHTEGTGGTGGGGGGSKMDSYYCGSWCLNDQDPSNDAVCKGAEFPGFSSGAVGDARGGSGGGGGGAVVIKALGPITVERSGRILCRGGQGGGGEQRACSNYGGAGGGGSGGAILLQSATDIAVRGPARLDVRGGAWYVAGANPAPLGTCDVGHNPAQDDFAPGDGGAGGAGIIQLQVPVGQVASTSGINSMVPFSSWVDQQNVANPAEFVSQSVAVSDWFDLGRMTQRAPLGANPSYYFRINGRRVQDGDPGLIETDASGNVLGPDDTDVKCGFLGVIDPFTNQYQELPRSDFIPPNATIRLEFQGGNPIVPGSREVDPVARTVWSASPSVANGRQFVRYRVTFDVAADGSPVTNENRRPIVSHVGIHAEF